MTTQRKGWDILDDQKSMFLILIVNYYCGQKRKAEMPNRAYF